MQIKRRKKEREGEGEGKGEEWKGKEVRKGRLIMKTFTINV